MEFSPSEGMVKTSPDSGHVVATALFGFLGIIAGHLQGFMSTALLVVSVLGLVICLLLAGSTWNNRFFRRLLRAWYYRTHYRTWVGHHDITGKVVGPDGGQQIVDESSHVSAFLLLPDHWALDNVGGKNQLVECPGFRCEVHRRWTRSSSRSPRIKTLSTGSLVAAFPDEFTTVIDGKRRVATRGRFVVRWKINGRRRALARKTVGYNGVRYLEHRLLRVLHTPQIFESWVDAREQELQRYA